MRYMKKSTQDVQNFIEGLRAEQALDSSDLRNAAPEEMQTVLDEAGKESDKVLKALDSALSLYEKEHGVAAPADIVENAIRRAFSTTEHARNEFALDSISATSDHHAQLALQPNRAVVAILASMAEAVPFAHYLPADIGSNEAILNIVSTRSAHKYGSYDQNGSMDGINSGLPYISTSRVHTSKPSSGNVTGKLTKVQTTPDTCESGAGDLKLLRGRTIVYVAGRQAATEMEMSGAGESPISGKITLQGVTYTITGNINTDTGAYTLNSAPNLPAEVDVVVEGFVDLERSPDLIPGVINAADKYSVYAKPWHVTTHQSISARTQFANELNLDPMAVASLAINNQFSNERHFEAIRKAMRIAAGNGNVETFDYDAHKAMHDGGRGSIWADLAYPLNVVSHQMALDTMSHGVTHIYVGKRVLAQLRALPSTHFQPSGLKDRPGIFRAGKLFGRFEVYFTPHGVSETSNSAQILCVGRADDAARSVIVMGDAVAPSIIPTALNGDLRQGAAFYARNFTSVNPHAPSAMGAALINVTNF